MASANNTNFSTENEQGKPLGFVKRPPAVKKTPLQRLGTRTIALRSFGCFGRRYRVNFSGEARIDLARAGSLSKAPLVCLS